MIATTSQSIDGHFIAEYCGIVTATAPFLEAISGKKENQYREMALNRLVSSLEEQACEKGANAIIAIQFQYHYPTGMREIAATGTAVKIERT